MTQKKSSDAIIALHDYNIFIECREIFLCDDISNCSLTNFHKNLRLLESSGKDKIRVNLTTDGGDLHSAFGIYDIISKSKHYIEIICSGGVFSAGTMILQAADSRLCFSNAWFLLHYGFSGSGEASYLDTKDHMKTHSKLIDKMIDIYSSKIANTTNKNEQEIKKMLRRKMSREWFLSADEAKEIGLIDEIV